MTAAPTTHEDERDPAHGLHVRGLEVQARGVPLVRDITFSAVPGRITGFLGPNGSGKTTTLRGVLGLVPRHAGTVSFDGHPFERLPRGEGGAVALFEHKGHDALRRADRHLAMVAAAMGAPREKVADALREVGLEGHRRKRIGTFSLGMRQRLGLAETVLVRPGVVLLDEPMNGLDPAGIRWMRNLLRRTADDGATVLVSTHMLHEAEQFVDDVVLLQDGRVAHQGPLDVFRDGAPLEQRFLELTEKVK